MRCSLAVVVFGSLLLAQDPKTPPKRPPARPQPELNKTVRFTAGAIADVAPVEVEAATKAAIAALLKLPESDDPGHWQYEGVYREDAAQLPIGYGVGGSSIVSLAMIAAPGYAQDKDRQAAVEHAVAYILKTLDVPRMQAAFEGTYDVRGWGHIYALQLFLELLEHKLVPAAHADAVAAKTKWLVATLCESAIPESGGWNYSRPRGYLNAKNTASTFMTAPALQVLFMAKQAGYEVDDKVLDQALDALDRARSAPGGYAYGAPAQSQNEVPTEKLAFMDQVPSSAARATACETTLLLAGRGDQERLHRAVLRFFENWDDLAVRKSQLGTHIKPYGIAPYYFLYGHLYAAQAIELLTDEAEKAKLRERMRAYLARSRDENGSWNDRQFDRSAGYGTALAILVMQMPHLPKPAARPTVATKKG